MRKIIFLVIIGFVLYKYRATILELPFIKQFTGDKVVQQVTNKVTETVKEQMSTQTVTDELKTWVLKDGVKLPKDWTLKEKTIGTQKVTIMVPPKPNSTDDYIALQVKKENSTKLPSNHTCTEGETVVNCLVGNNLETLKTFSVLTFVK